MSIINKFPSSGLRINGVKRDYYVYNDENIKKGEFVTFQDGIAEQVKDFEPIPFFKNWALSNSYGVTNISYYKKIRNTSNKYFCSTNMGYCIAIIDENSITFGQPKKITDFIASPFEINSNPDFVQQISANKFAILSKKASSSHPDSYYYIDYILTVLEFSDILITNIFQSVKESSFRITDIKGSMCSPRDNYIVFGTRYSGSSKDRGYVTGLVLNEDNSLSEIFNTSTFAGTSYPYDLYTYKTNIEGVFIATYIRDNYDPEYQYFYSAYISPDNLLYVSSGISASAEKGKSIGYQWDGESYFVFDDRFNSKSSKCYITLGKPIVSLNGTTPSITLFTKTIESSNDLISVTNLYLFRLNEGKLLYARNGSSTIAYILDNNFNILAAGTCQNISSNLSRYLPVIPNSLTNNSFYQFGSTIGYKILYPFTVTETQVKKATTKSEIKGVAKKSGEGADTSVNHVIHKDQIEIFTL